MAPGTPFFTIYLTFIFSSQMFSSFITPGHLHIYIADQSYFLRKMSKFAIVSHGLLFFIEGDNMNNMNIFVVVYKNMYIKIVENSSYPWLPLDMINKQIL